MKVTDVRRGEFISRDNWGYSKKLAITVNDSYNLVYISNGNVDNTSNVEYSSSAYNYDDFYLSDQYGNRLTIQKEKQMRHTEIKYIVANNKSNSVKCFTSEEDRDDYIEDQLDVYSRIKFVIFEPTYKVEPKKQSLKELFERITS